jgi:hypothetical protein
MTGTEDRDIHTKAYATCSDETWGVNPICSIDGYAWPCDTAIAQERVADLEAAARRWLAEADRLDAAGETEFGEPSAALRRCAADILGPGCDAAGPATAGDDPIEVTLTFRGRTSDLVGDVADAYAEGRTSGITEEGTGAELTRRHRAIHGYVGWSIEPYHGHMLPTPPGP